MPNASSGPVGHGYGSDIPAARTRAARSSPAPRAQVRSTHVIGRAAGNQLKNGDPSSGISVRPPSLSAGRVSGNHPVRVISASLRLTKLKIAGLVCFYDEKVDVYLDGELQERPRTHFA